MIQVAIDLIIMIKSNNESFSNDTIAMKPVTMIQLAMKLVYKETDNIDTRGKGTINNDTNDNESFSNGTKCNETRYNDTIGNETCTS